MSNWWIDIGKVLLEERGRTRTATRYPFQANEIVTAGYTLKVSPWLNGVYINLHPTHYAVAVSPDGRILNLRGGYNRLSPGRYLLHYVDKQNRVSVVPLAAETTFDGSQVSLELVITYRVIDPIKALEVQHAIDTLLLFIQSDLKESIRSHRYDEIVGDLEGRKIDNERLAYYIKDQHASRHQMSRLFFIADVVVEQKIGDPKVTEIRESFQIKQRQNLAETELLKQNQELEKKVAAQEALIKQIKVESEATQQEIRQKMDLQKIELERVRTEFHFRQERWKRAMDAIAQAFSAQTYPRDPREVEIIRELLNEMGGPSNRTPESTSAQEDNSSNGPTGISNPEKIDTLTNTLLSWLDRKRS
jgi:hypothetical protein